MRHAAPTERDDALFAPPERYAMPAQRKSCRAKTRCRHKERRFTRTRAKMPFRHQFISLRHTDYQSFIRFTPIISCSIFIFAALLMTASRHYYLSFSIFFFAIFSFSSFTTDSTLSSLLPDFAFDFHLRLFIFIDTFRAIYACRRCAARCARAARWQRCNANICAVAASEARQRRHFTPLMLFFAP
jgi:hypothetical protein